MMLYVQRIFIQEKNYNKKNYKFLLFEKKILFSVPGCMPHKFQFSLLAPYQFVSRNRSILDFYLLNKGFLIIRHGFNSNNDSVNDVTADLVLKKHFEFGSAVLGDL